MKMRGFFAGYAVKERKVIVGDDELIKVLKILQLYNVRDYTIVTCGWGDSDDWCLYFDASERDWDCITLDFVSQNIKNIKVFGRRREEI